MLPSKQVGRVRRMRTVLIANRKGGVGKTMMAVTIASALANRGERVALADADRQQSSLGWLKRRPATVAQLRGLNWSKSADIGENPKSLDWLVIDAPGALKGAKAQALIYSSEGKGWLSVGRMRPGHRAVDFVKKDR